MSKPSIEYSEFEKMDLRVGQVTAVSEPEWSRKLLEITVSFGEEIGQKTVLSGIKKWYTADDLVGKKFGFIINLPERKMGEGVSQAMMLMADEAEQPVLVPFPATVIPGTIIR